MKITVMLLVWILFGIAQWVIHSIRLTYLFDKNYDDKCSEKIDEYLEEDPIAGGVFNYERGDSFSDAAKKVDKKLGDGNFAIGLVRMIVLWPMVTGAFEDLYQDAKQWIDFDKSTTT